MRIFLLVVLLCIPSLLAGCGGGGGGGSSGPASAGGGASTTQSISASGTTPPPATSPTPAASPTPSTSPTPAASPTPSPLTSPTPAPSPTPATSPTPVPLPSASGRLVAGQGFLTAPFPAAIVAADMDGDGRPDLISGGPSGVSVLLAQASLAGSVPALSFGAPTTAATAHATVSLAVGHLRASSTRPDVVSASAAGTGTISIIPNNTAGGVLSLGPSVDIDTGGANAVAVADLDNDNLDDIVVADANDTRITVLHNLGNLTFAASTIDVGGTPTSITTADFNQDGRRDIAVTTATNVVVVLNQGSLTFAAPVSFALPVAGRAIAASDLDGDGIPDIAAVTDSDNVSVFLSSTARNAPTATFGAAQNIPVTDARSIALIDMNADGKVDLVVGDGGPADARTGGVSVLRNNSTIGNLSFALSAHGTGGFQTAGVAVADFNGDGRPDIATASTQIGTVVTFVNLTVSGSPTVTLETAPQFAAGAAPYGLALADVDGDGRLDVVVSNASANTVSVLLNTSSGALPSFAAPRAFSSGGTRPQGLALADVDGDGLLDIVVANATSNSIAVLRNTGGGNFAAAVTAPVGAAPLAVAVADIDGDGRADIVAANGGAASVSVVRGASSSGSIAFAGTSTLTVDSPPTALVLRDLDGDGRPDIAVTVDIGRVNVLINGGGSFAAPFSIAVQGGPTGLACADIDGDGLLDLVESAHGGVTVLRNTSTAANPSFVPTNIGIDVSQANSIALVDVDNDGRPDIVLGGTFNDTLVLRNTTPGPGTQSFSAPAVYQSGNVSQAFIAVGDINGDRRPDVVSPNFLEGTIAVLLGY